MKHDALKEALHRRKGSNVDITLVIGGDDKKPEDKGDNKELAPDVKDTGMAPEVDQSLMGPPNMKPETGHSDEAADRELITKMLGEHEANEPDEAGPAKPPTIKSRAHALMKSKLKK